MENIRITYCMSVRYNFAPKNTQNKKNFSVYKRYNILINSITIYLLLFYLYLF